MEGKLLSGVKLYERGALRDGTPSSCPVVSWLPLPLSSPCKRYHGHLESNFRGKKITGENDEFG